MARSTCSIVSDFNALFAATFDLAMDAIEIVSVINSKSLLSFLLQCIVIFFKLKLLYRPY